MPQARIAPESAADYGHVRTECCENPAGATVGVSEGRQQKSINIERALPLCDRPLRGLAKHAAQTRLRSAKAKCMLVSGRERVRTRASPSQCDALTDKRLRHVAVDAQHGDQHMLTSERSRLRRHRLFVREPKHAARRLGHRHPGSVGRCEISIATMSGLARDAQGAGHVAKRSAGGEPAFDLLAVVQLKLATQFGQRLERAQGNVGFARLLSQAADSLSPSSHYLHHRLDPRKVEPLDECR